MKSLVSTLGVSAAVALLMATSVEATLVTSLPGGTVVPMPPVNHLNLFNPAPQVFGPGITWTSTNMVVQGGALFGYTGSYGFRDNGFWDGGLGPMAGLNDNFDAVKALCDPDDTACLGRSDSMTFAFSSPIRGVGGFVNYTPGGSTPTVLAVYDSSNQLIESYSLNFNFHFPVPLPDDLTPGPSVGGNQGVFVGFLETTPSISRFTLTDNYVAVTDLTVDGIVPEPATASLVGLGLLAASWIGRRRGSRRPRARS